MAPVKIEAGSAKGLVAVEGFRVLRVVFFFAIVVVVFVEEGETVVVAVVVVDDVLDVDEEAEE